MKDLVRAALAATLAHLSLPATVVELTPAKGRGDFATNAALKLAKIVGSKPLELAERIATALGQNELIASAVVAPPGFINITVSATAYEQQVAAVLAAGATYGRGANGRAINVEYVSANPTGYLHLGHARGAALGSALVNILRFAGNRVEAEFYINDQGNQIDILGQSVFVRYLQALGHEAKMPDEAYLGTDIKDCAQELVQQFGNRFSDRTYADVAAEFRERAKQFFLRVNNTSLENFGVHIDRYFSEGTLYDTGQIDRTLVKLSAYVYERDGATWLATTRLGDDKDRVLRKQDGTYTYFMPDIAYHDNKVMRGYDELINVWGADHIGYIPRMRAALQMLGLSADRLDILVVQLVSLVRDGVEVKMSKRRGTTYTLNDIIEDIGVDATRWFLLDRASSSAISVDLNLALATTNDNPLFTVQYAHARANQLQVKSNLTPVAGLYEAKETALINHCALFPELVAEIARHHKVHLLPQYLLDLARLFNSWYSNSRVHGNPREAALLALAAITQQVLQSGLALLGISAPRQV